jgi:rSAM/selenodomain-associated transferase 2
VPLSALSVIVPTLESARHLPETLQAIRRGRPAEILVVDGGSSDGAAHLAEQEGARVVHSPSGRGFQCAAGARAATGSWLLFLPPETRLGERWPAAARHFVERTGAAQRAGWFRLAFDEDSDHARRLAAMANWRSRKLGLPFGDQGLLISRAFYEALGGHRLQGPMEDVDLARRIGRERLVELPCCATVSAVRHRREGWLVRPARTTAMLSLYYMGVPPAVLARFGR